MKRFRGSRNGQPPAQRMQRINQIVPKFAKNMGILLLAFVGFLGVASYMGYTDYDMFGTGNSPASSGRRLLGASDTRHCPGDTLLPLVPYEQTWVIGVRVPIYLFALCYFFLGVAISADVFMSSIEVITSKTRTVMVRGQEVEIEIWNDTVANLTLMALGSSAPEILLAVVETVSMKFEAGALGPGTIVGSAAFNLLFITAICISALPVDDDLTEENGGTETCESRIIEEFGVYGITAFASLFAYFWMVIVIDFTSPNVIDIPEAIITLLMFPLLVFVSWAQDNGWWMSSDKVAPDDEATAGPGHASHVSINTGDGKVRRPSTSMTAQEASKIVEVDDVKANPEEAAKRAAEETMKKKKKSILQHRIQATRKMTGGKRVLPTKKAKADTATAEEEVAAEPTEMTLGFEEKEYSVLENCGTVQIKVQRAGPIDQPCTVQFDTSDGTATGGEDYIHTAGALQFKADEPERLIEIEIIDDNEWQPDQHFFVRLFNPSDGLNIGVATTQVIILNDDNPGKIGFKSKTMHAVDTETLVQIPLDRRDGIDGNVLAFVKTMDGTAKAGEHYEAIPEDWEGEAAEDPRVVHFEHADQEKTVNIKLHPNPSVSDTGGCTFTVTITGVEPEGAAVGEVNMCTVIISNDKNYQKLMEEVVAMMDEEMGKYHVGTSTWSEQFHDAMNMGGDDDSEPEWGDYLLHFCSFYWKVLHAIIPPTEYYGGWATFVISLAFIGGITVFVGDIAKMFGCCLGLPDATTAITFVALGTSLPDTFASVEATQSDETADAAITNVTGSNSVNVFLGLGLPWTMAAIYHSANGTTYNYPSDGLTFSVLVFFGFAVVCLAILLVRRFFMGGELGGNKLFANLTSLLLVCLWTGYVVISAIKNEAEKK